MAGKAHKNRLSAAVPPSEAHHKRPKVVVTISEDVLGIVMEFLSPKQLFRMALTCKALRGRITTKLVTRSAIMHGGSPRATVKELYRLIQYGTIHVPSPLRLLRLCNGKQCESCNTNIVRHANQGLGTFLCNKCLTKGPDSIVLRVTPAASRKLRSYQEVVRDDRLTGRFSHPCRAANFFNAILREPMTQLGEPCGPRFTYQDLERIEASSEPVEEMIDEIFRSTPEQQDGRDFLETYEASVEEAKAADEYRKAKKEAAAKRAAQVRLASALKVVSKVQDDLLDPWKDFVLANEETGYAGKGEACLKFHSPLCNELLKEYVTFPSKAKTTIITEIAATINSFCLEITEHLCGWSFLSDDNPFEKSLKLYCQGTFPDLKSLVIHGSATSRFMEVLSKDNSFAALKHHLGGDFGCLLEADEYDSYFNVSRAWSAGYKQHEDEPCERTRQSKTFVTCMEWQASLNEYLEYLKVHAEKGHIIPSYSISWEIVSKEATRELLIKGDYKQLMDDNEGIGGYFFD